jgi:ketopantoate reductase
MTKILIVGAGALGTVAGYHLALGGSEVTFFVRSARLAEMRPPLVLYCYDDAALRQFGDYKVVSSIAEVAAQRFDYVLVTFDGAVCRSAEGTQLLAELGDAIRGSDAVLVIGGVGVREHYLKTTRLPEARLLEGTLGSLSYQVGRVTLPLHEPTDAAVLAQASVAYHHFDGIKGYMVAGEPAAAAKAFAAVYDRCGISKCVIMNADMFNILSTAFFPLMAVCDLAGWPDAASMAANTALMRLCARAMREISALPRHGFIGKLVSLMIWPPVVGMLLKKLEKDCLPLDFHGFNKFHHGGKVRAQDIDVMRACAQSGAAQGQNMPALNALVRRYEAHCAAAG